jgi:AcrR family transcriptional regulator
VYSCQRPGGENLEKDRLTMTRKTDTHREPLTAPRIIRAAMAIADREGLEALSMRRVAAELDATPMALYNHVAGKDELLDGIAGEMLKEIDLSALDPSDWAGAIKTGYGEFRRVLLAHPNLLQVMQRKTNITPDGMRPIELSLSLLRSAGFGPEEALQAHWVLTGYTMGHVVWQQASPLFDKGGGNEMALEHHRSLPQDQFPCLHEVLPALERCDMESAFQFGLDALIEGFKAQIAAAGT